MPPLPIDTDDGALMERIGTRDEEAFRIFYRRHSPLVYALCLRVLRDPRDAEDILTDVFWSIWNKAERYDQYRGSPRSFLLLVARSKAIDRRRSLMRHMPAVAIATDTADESRSELPWQQLHDDEQRQAVRHALVRLHPLQRQAIELAFFDGLNHREIAERTGFPLGTIKFRIRSGLQKLKSALQSVAREWSVS